MDRIDEIRARLAAATPGPWVERELTEEEGGDMVEPIVGGLNDDSGLPWKLFYPEDATQTDIDLVANAPDDLHYLLDAYEAARDVAVHLTRGLYNNAEEVVDRRIRELIAERMSGKVGE